MLAIFDRSDVGLGSIDKIRWCLQQIGLALAGKKFTGFTALKAIGGKRQTSHPYAQ